MKLKKILTPSILDIDLFKFKDIMKVFEKEELTIHFDVMDNHFVNNYGLGTAALNSINKNSNLKCDVHLMVSNPIPAFNVFVQYKPKSITVHTEVIKLEELRELKIIADKNDINLGISINPSTKVDQNFIDKLRICDLVVVMSVNPGKGGQSFIEATFEKISKLDALKNKLNNFEIIVDGGVNFENYKKVLNAGANKVVMGSALLKYNIIDRLDLLKVNL